MHPAYLVFHALVFSLFPGQFVLYAGIEEASGRRGSGMKSTRQRAVKGHRMCSATCVVDYDIHHVAACH